MSRGAPVRTLSIIRWAEKRDFIREGRRGQTDAMAGRSFSIARLLLIGPGHRPKVTRLRRKKEGPKSPSSPSLWYKERKEPASATTTTTAIRGGHDDFWAKRERDGTQSVDKQQASSEARGIGFDPVGTWRHWILLSLSLMLFGYVCCYQEGDYGWRWWSSSSSSPVAALSIQISRGMRRAAYRSG